MSCFIKEVDPPVEQIIKYNLVCFMLPLLFHVHILSLSYNILCLGSVNDLAMIQSGLSINTFNPVQIKQRRHQRDIIKMIISSVIKSQLIHPDLRDSTWSSI